MQPRDRAIDSRPTPSTSGQDAPRMQSRVQLESARGSTRQGVLEWGADDRIRLFAVDPITDQPGDILFDCAPGDVQKVQVSPTRPSLRVQDRKHVVNFSPSATPQAVVRDVVGRSMAPTATREHGIQWWVDAFRSRAGAVALHPALVAKVSAAVVLFAVMLVLILATVVVIVLF